MLEVIFEILEPLERESSSWVPVTMKRGIFKLLKEKFIGEVRLCKLPRRFSSRFPSLLNSGKNLVFC